MPDRRGSRFAAEVLFLIALAVGLALAALAPLLIGGVMLAGWLIVAAVEWAAWRDEPHYGAGLPPRYYVPRVSLPPPQPLEQVAAGYPEAQRDEAPTWIASAALRAEMAGEWPVSAQPGDDEAGEDDVEDDVEPVRLPAPAVEAEPELRPEPEPEPEPKPVAVVPLPQPAEDESASEQEVEPKPAIDAPLSSPTALPSAVAWYHLEPFAEPPQRRLFRRRAEAGSSALEVPARPRTTRALPGGAGRAPRQ